MTTPDTSAVRSWARENGYDVSDRGRLPVEVQDAYVAAHRRSSKAAAKAPAKSTAKPAAKSPAKSTAKPAARKKAAPAKKAAGATDTQTAAAAPAVESAEQGRPQPKPSPVTDDRRLVALGEEIAALTGRVAALEDALGTKGNGKGNGKAGSKTARFRRSR